MKAAFGIAGVVLVTLAAWFALGVPVAPKILITNVVAQPMGTKAYGVVMSIDNQGAPDRLQAVESGAADVMLVIPDGAPDLAVHTGVSSLAMEAAHVHVMRGESPFEEGTLLPLTIRFERAGEVHVKARVVAGATSGHAAMMGGAGHETLAGQAPAISLEASPHADGWRVTLQTTGFIFSKAAADGKHQDGVGHGHIFLGAMKLGRVYGPHYDIGALPKGTHKVRVTLNTNDHRAYYAQGAPVSATAVIVVD